MAAETYPASEESGDDNGLRDRLGDLWRSLTSRYREEDGTTETDEEDLLPTTYTVDADDLGDLLEEADGVYRDIPLRVWDPTVTLDHPEQGYIDGETLGSQYDWIREEWNAEPDDLTVFHSGNTLKARCDVALEYDGTLDTEATTAMSLRIDLDRYLPEEQAVEKLEGVYGLE